MTTQTLMYIAVFISGMFAGVFGLIAVLWIDLWLERRHARQTPQDFRDFAEHDLRDSPKK